METPSIKILGDGIAGTLLAAELLRQGLPFLQYGDGRSQTPPVAFVHLFQGRTFRRDPLETDAFRWAVDHWRREEWALEWAVERSVSEGDRLHRSAGTDSIPEEFRPQALSPLTFLYKPGFTVAAAAIQQRERDKFRSHIRSEHADPEDLEGPVVHASGLAIQTLLPSLPWDINSGRTVCARSSRPPTRLILDGGCHLGANPRDEGFTIGGRVNSKGRAKNDELELASEILGAEVHFQSEWWGKRIANAHDRWPLMGWLDEKNFAFAGFGGRALFWLPYCCSLAAEALHSGSNRAIPEKLRADRFRLRGENSDTA